MADLVAEHLSFSFGGDQSVIDDLSLTVAVGQSVVILGANGSGKTTLLRLLAGLIQPHAGRVLINGSPLDENPTQVGILFQNPEHQMITATVQEEIALGMEFRGRPVTEIRPQVELLLERFRLTELRKQPLAALSGGQMQRVALAAIMAAQPSFLLFDEPDSFLDAPSRREFMIGVDTVLKECGIIWTIPHPRRAPVADRYYLLQDGRLQSQDRSTMPPLSSHEQH